MTDEQWDAMQPSQQWLRTAEWLEVRQAEAEAAADARSQRAANQAHAQLEEGFRKGLGS